MPIIAPLWTQKLSGRGWNASASDTSSSGTVSNTSDASIWDQNISYKKRLYPLSHLRDRSDKFSLLAIHAINQGISENIEVRTGHIKDVSKGIYVPSKNIEFRQRCRHKEIHRRDYK